MNNLKKIIGITLMSVLFVVGNAYGWSFRRSKPTAAASAPKPAATTSRWGSFKAGAAKKWAGAKARTKQAGTRFAVRTGLMKEVSVPQPTVRKAQQKKSRWAKPGSGKSADLARSASSYADTTAKYRKEQEAKAAQGGFRGWLAGGSFQ